MLVAENSQISAVHFHLSRGRGATATAEMAEVKPKVLILGGVYTCVYYCVCIIYMCVYIHVLYTCVCIYMYTCECIIICLYNMYVEEDIMYTHDS